MTLESREPQVGPICCRALRALFCPSRLRSRLQAFCFRELPVGPVTASTSRSVLLFWHWCLGSRRPALFAADLCGRKLFCPLCFRSRLSALRFQEMPGGPVAAIPWRQELLLGAGVSEAAGRPCLLQASSFWVPSIGPYSCTWDVCCSQCLRSLLQALCFRVLSGGPVAVLFPRASGAACWPCSRCLRLKALSTGPLLLGAVRRPCCCRPFCFGCRLPAHSTVLGDVHGSIHSASRMSATASLPSSLAFTVPAGGGFHAQSVCVSGVSDAATSCLKS